MLNEQENKTSGFVVPTSAIYPCVLCFRLLQPALQRAFRPKRLPTQSAALQSCTTCWHQTCVTCSRQSAGHSERARPPRIHPPLSCVSALSHSPPRSPFLVLAEKITFQTQLTQHKVPPAHRHTTRLASSCSHRKLSPVLPLLAPHHILVHLRLIFVTTLSSGRCTDHDMRCSSTSRLRSQQFMAG